MVLLQSLSQILEWKLSGLYKGKREITALLSTKLSCRSSLSSTFICWSFCAVNAFGRTRTLSLFSVLTFSREKVRRWCKWSTTQLPFYHVKWDLQFSCWELFLAGVNLSYTKKTQKELEHITEGCSHPCNWRADHCLCCVFHLVMPKVCEYVYLNKCVCAKKHFHGRCL